VIDKDKLKALQLVEAGYATTIPATIPIWNGEYISGKNKVSKFNAKHAKCTICGINEPLIWHHVFTKSIKGQTSTSGRAKLSDFMELLGLVRICPNCHYYIHQANPFSGKGI